MRYMKNHEFIAIDGSDVTFNIDISTPENQGLFFISVPSLKIYSTANSRNAIKLAASTAIDSFLNYWLKRKNQQEFSDHLNALGFTFDPNSTAYVSRESDQLTMNEPSTPYGTEKNSSSSGITNSERFIYKTKLPQ